YTQQEIKDVVEYASSKYISIVPEIEGVAHVMSAIASYSHLSCSQEQIMVPSGGVWPITEIFCPGKESTFEFIENVLDEVVELFPSKYIHIGGDEATKTNWKKCDHCQKRIADEGLKNEEELQSYMVKRISKYLKTKGRYMIGWDEILEGGLAEGAVVMSWRGTEGGLEAASMKHNVIMSPDTYWYLDHYQGNKSEEPLAIGGYSTLNHVYSFDPIPAEMPIEDQQYVMGAQANVWTEYMPNLEHLQYMILPRMLAVSEVLWTKPENKNWDDFSERVKFMFRRLDVLGINYSKSSYNIRSEKAINPENKQLELKLFNEYKQTEIRYEIGRKLPDINSPIYTKPIKITGNTRINASVFESGNIVGSVFTDSITVFENIAKGALVSYNNTYSPKYSSGKKFGLVDGLIGSTAFDDRYWQGWFDKDVFFDVDMQQNKTISGLRLSFLVDRGNQILMSRNVKIFYSKDGENYELIKEFFPTVTEDNTKRKEILKVKELKLNARYFRVEVANSSNEDTGEKGWVFIDEFVVE
ncbi:MAG: family 20 glycosylhydrolase, partial [Bacteroidota bacterium]